MVQQNDGSDRRTKMEGGALSQLIRAFETTTCKICGSVVTVLGLSEHMLADVRMLRIIQTTHPEWESKECEAHLKSLFGHAPGSCPGITPIEQEDADWNNECDEA